jgi:hypothetical protein
VREVLAACLFVIVLLLAGHASHSFVHKVQCAVCLPVCLPGDCGS